MPEDVRELLQNVANCCKLLPVKLIGWSISFNNCYLCLSIFFINLGPRASRMRR